MSRALEYPECGAAVTVSEAETPATEVLDAILIDPAEEVLDGIIIDPIEAEQVLPPAAPAPQTPLSARQSSLRRMLLGATVLLLLMMCLVGLGVAALLYVFRSSAPKMAEVQERPSMTPARSPGRGSAVLKS